VATRAERIIASLTWVGLTPEEIADTLAECGATPDEVLDRVLAAIRADQEEEIEFRHTVIEHEQAIEGEWSSEE
jgi:hypothetical protein